MNVVFLGSGAFGLPTLAALAGGGRHAITGIVTQPDRPAGRGGKLTPTPVGAWAADRLPGVPLLRLENVNEPHAIGAIRSWPADAWVVIAFGQRLSRRLLEDRFAVNLHASLLPRWRGAAPINAAILAGDAMTGNSAITLADRMDAGLVLGQTRREIDPMLTAGELHDLLAGDGPGLIGSVLDRHGAGMLDPRAQDESGVTAAPKLGRGDGWVDFTQTAEACRRRVHGLTPWPGVTITFQGGSLKLVRVQPLAADTKQWAPGTWIPSAPPAPALAADTEQWAPGTLVDAELGTVACADGSALRLLEVQPAGGRAMTWPAFARGRRVAAGEALVGGRTAC